jgi:DNA-binding MarR family transcriptional regulator
MSKESDPDVEGLARQMMAWVHLSMRLNRGSEDAKAMAAVGLTLQQIVTLHVLNFEGPRSVSQLTEALGLSMSATSHLVQRLLEQEYVTREEHPGDRRQKRVAIAPGGKKVVEKMIRMRQREMRVVSEALSPQLRKRLSGVLGDVIEELSRAAGPGPASHPSHSHSSHSHSKHGSKHNQDLEES